MEIKEFNYNTRLEYLEFIDKCKKSKCLSLLNTQTFSEGRRIFLILEKNLFKKYIIIGYSIIYEDLHLMCLSNNISEKYDGDFNTVFIFDFMIDFLYRKQGYGKALAKYIIENVYENKNIILQPDDDGFWFWKKFGFVDDNVSKNTIWILDKNKGED